MVAALTVALYAGFRFNECLGTDLVLMQEPAAAALSFLHILNSKRTPAVSIMVVTTLACAVMAVRKARPRRLAVVGLALLLAEDVLTFRLHVPFVLVLQSTAAGIAPPHWSWLRARYVFDDVSRTALLLAAAIVFIQSGIQNMRKEPS